MRTTHYVAAGAIFIARMAAAFVFLGSGRSKKELPETAAETTKPSEANTNNAEWYQFEYGPSHTKKYKNGEAEKDSRGVRALRVRNGKNTVYLVEVSMPGNGWHLREDEARSMLNFIDTMGNKQPSMKGPVKSSYIAWSCLGRNKWGGVFTDRVEFVLFYDYAGNFSFSGGNVFQNLQEGELPAVITSIRLALRDVEAMKQVGSPPTP